MMELMKQMIRKYGTPMELQRGTDTKQIRGFLQPARSKNWQKMEKEVSPLGEIPGGLYVFIGEAGCVAVGDTLLLGGNAYLLRQLDTIYYRDADACCWGLCSRKGGEDTWGM